MIRNYEKEVREKAGILAVEVWVPKAKELVDYKIPGEEFFIPAEVVSAVPDEEDASSLIVTVKYPTANGRYVDDAIVVMPSDDLKKCGR